MITLEMQPDDLLETRFGYSPLLELVLSYVVLHKVHSQSLHAAWIDEVSCLLQGTYFPYMSAVMLLPGYVSDIVTPTPTAAVRTIDDAFAGLMATPDHVVRRYILEMLDHVRLPATPIHEAYLEDPRSALQCLLAEMAQYWSLTLAHHWPRIHTVLENEVLYRGRQNALSGIESVLADLSHLIRYQAGAVQITPRHTKLHHDALIRLAGQGLQLVPAVFAAGHINWQVAADWKPMVIYGARGAGLWHQQQPRLNASLNSLIGASKTRILQALAHPLNTGELAVKLAVTPGAVSQHLTQLSEVGLVEAHRSGNRVYYRLSPRGENLLNLFADT